MGFSRQEYWSGLPFPSPGDLPDPGIEPRSPTLQANALTSEPPGKTTLYKAHTNHWTNLRKEETKRKKEFNHLQGKNSTFLEACEKTTPNTIIYKKIMKRERNTAQMKEHTRNTEVKINEEEIGKLPEKEFRIMIVKMIKNLENKMEKMQESINKT